MKYNRKEIQFINHVRKVGKIYGIKCSLRNTKYVIADNLKCAGWFEEGENSLVVAMNRPDWLEILAHEYSHLTQYIENNDIWIKGNNSCGKMGEWLNGKYIKNINHHIDNVKLMELDNEKRSVNVIKSFGLNVNIDNYIKKANSYIHFYNWLKETRRWPDPKNSPYNNKNILSLMSSKFDMKYNTSSKKIISTFKKENI